MRGRLSLVLAAGWLLSSPVQAAEPPPRNSQLRGWSLGGFVDFAYAFNSNLPDNHVSRGRTLVPRTGEFVPNLGLVYLRRDLQPRSPWFFELALQAGPVADAAAAGEPSPGGDSSRYAGPEVWKHLGRANVGGRLGGSEIAVGLFGTPIGWESYWSKENWHYSVSWQLDSVPYYLAGVRLRQAIGEKFTLHGWIVNGYQTLADANKAPSYLTGFAWTPNPETILHQMFYFGPEQQELSPKAWRVLSDTHLVWNRERIGFAAVFDVGQEKLMDLPGRPRALWIAAAVNARWRVFSAPSMQWDMALRPLDLFWDRDGKMFGTKQLLVSVTYSNIWRLFDALLFKFEYRWDHGTSPRGFFFAGGATTADSPGLARQQHLAILSLVGYLDYPLRR